MKAITTRYHGPSNVRGSRISATDGDNRIYISMDPEWNGDTAHEKACEALCHKMGWKGRLQHGHLGNDHVFVWLADYDVMEVK